MSREKAWWKSAVFYQIYPRSFADGNGDGMGDFTGMIRKLDYLKDLGVDAVWLSPHYPSPYVDCGYDISDYTGIASEYGTMDDFKLFLEGLHQRGMYLILDLVLNHTSDQHPWFIESRSSLENPKRDWYVWKRGAQGKEPNNWYSTFGGSAWTLDEKSGEYYYHFFFKEQPDLNWKNPEVKKAMFDAVRFWLDLGVDGFRLDAIGTIFEDERYLNQPEPMTLQELIEQQYLNRQQNKVDLISAQSWEKMFQYQHDLPEVHELMKELRQVIDEYDHRVLVGESEELSFYGNGEDELHLVFNFPLMKKGKIDADLVRKNQKERLSGMPRQGWPCNTFGNHDSPRMINQFGDGEHNELIARLNLMLLLTMRGTPFLYNGEEIGMSDHTFENIDDFRDPLSRDYALMCQKLSGLSLEKATRLGSDQGRDKCRTPMQWSAAANGGFCPETVRPWLPMNPEYQKGINVADEVNNADSLWHFYRRLLHLRKNFSALQTGRYKEINSRARDLMIFERALRGERLWTFLNFSGDQIILERTAFASYEFQLLIEGIPGQWNDNSQTISIAPYGCAIVETANKKQPQ